MDILSTLFHQQKRKIELFVPSVVISEKHVDTLEITQHPVEDKAPITDHAFRLPAEVVMEVGFAGGGSLLDLLETSSYGLSYRLGPQEIYMQLLELQRSRVPFDVVTGKRLYRNMLMRVLDVTTDKAKENVLSATLTLREVLITSAQNNAIADKTNMSQGVSTSAIQNAGVKSLKPVNKPGLY